MSLIMTGAIAMAFAVAAVFFLKFWRETRDRLFAFFALSFLALAVNRVALGLTVERGTDGDYLYWVRLLAFAIILAAILDKNRSRPASSHHGAILEGVAKRAEVAEPQ